MPTDACKNTSNPRRKAFIVISIILFTLLMLAALYVRLTIRRYEIDAQEITENINIAFVADLHSCSYGPEQKH